MRNIIAAAVFALFLSVSFGASAAAPPPVIVKNVGIVAVGGGGGVGVFLGAVGLAAGASYLILAQKDQYDEPVWHRLACGLFGDEGRVGTETDSACKHIE